MGGSLDEEARLPDVLAVNGETKSEDDVDELCTDDDVDDDAIKTFL
ncbi:MAG: hypothetical protein HY861_03360 [Chlamydiia bacterium]|nr:hypothetical protein [Chlamydiia bacterium]